MKKLQLAVILISISLLAGFKGVATKNAEQVFLDHGDECLSIIEQEAKKNSYARGGYGSLYSW